MTVFLVVAVGCLWVVAIIALGRCALDAFDHRKRFKGATLGLASICLFALGPGVVAAWDPSTDANANRLCLHGYQVWRRVNYPPVIVGKLIMPAHSSAQKVWICQQWEVPQASGGSR